MDSFELKALEIYIFATWCTSAVVLEPSSPLSCKVTFKIHLCAQDSCSVWIFCAVNGGTESCSTALVEKCEAYSSVSEQMCSAGCFVPAHVWFSTELYFQLLLLLEALVGCFGSIVVTFLKPSFSSAFLAFRLFSNPWILVANWPLTLSLCSCSHSFSTSAFREAGMAFTQWPTCCWFLKEIIGELGTQSSR